MELVPRLLPQISRIPVPVLHEGFTLNVLARLPSPWTYTVQRLISHCLIHRILPQIIKDHTKVSILKPGDPFTSLPIILNYGWAVCLTKWTSDRMSNGLERANTLSLYITTCHKGKSIDNSTLNTQKRFHEISVTLSYHIENKFDRIITETQLIAMYQHKFPRHGYAK